VLLAGQVPEARVAVRVTRFGGRDHEFYFGSLSGLDGHGQPRNAIGMHLDSTNLDAGLDQPAPCPLKRFEMGKFMTDIPHDLNPPSWSLCKNEGRRMMLPLKSPERQLIFYSVVVDSGNPPHTINDVDPSLIFTTTITVGRHPIAHQPSSILAAGRKKARDHGPVIGDVFC
jgi:hypothetical protein